MPRARRDRSVIRPLKFDGWICYPLWKLIDQLSHMPDEQFAPHHLHADEWMIIPTDGHDGSHNPLHILHTHVLT